jgi:hypothetical protein
MKPSYEELKIKIENYELALNEIAIKGGYKIRGNVANELAEISLKVLRENSKLE